MRHGLIWPVSPALASSLRKKLHKHDRNNLHGDSVALV
jgi:hypothetical protein